MNRKPPPPSMPSSDASEPHPPLPTIDDISAAARRLHGQAVLTPLLESPLLNARLGGRLLVKAEPLQRTGSFKFRGAFNALAQLEPQQRRAGVVAFSSGNHAQGVAAAAQLLGLPATIVMPEDAPAIKIANTRGYGAAVVLYDRLAEDREAIGRRIAAERGAVLIPPFDDARVIAGQGTAGLEIASQAKALDLRLDAAVIPCSGGGLAAGCALALAALCPGITVHTAEPQGFDDMRRSLQQGERVANVAAAGSICDALLVPIPGKLQFAIARRHIAGGLAVSDDAVLRAMAVAFAEFKLVVEPGGAVALAAILSGKLDIKGRVVAVIASGGNVDAQTFAQALARGAQP
jgi:threonine dehydratase